MLSKTRVSVYWEWDKENGQTRERKDTTKLLHFFSHCHSQLRLLTRVPTNNQLRSQLELSLSNSQTNIK